MEWLAVPEVCLIGLVCGEKILKSPRALWQDEKNEREFHGLHRRGAGEERHMQAHALKTKGFSAPGSTEGTR